MGPMPIGVYLNCLPFTLLIAFTLQKPQNPRNIMETHFMAKQS